MSIECLSDRYAKALRLREEGFTYNEIGINLGIGSERARQIVFSAKLKLSKPDDDFKGLSIRASNCLKAAGYRTKEDVSAGLKSGSISIDGKNKIIGYGKKTHIEVCKWIGIQNKAKEKTIRRYIEFLERNGYVVTEKVQ